MKFSLVVIAAVGEVIVNKEQNIFEILRRNPLLLLTIFVAIMIAGIFLSDIPRMIASQNWPVVEGTVISRRLVGQKFKEYDGDYYTNIDGYIRYEYSVGGIVYYSTAVNSINTPSYPYIIALQYPVGKVVKVYFNPKNPTEAVLEPGFVFSAKGFGFFLFVIFTTGVLIVIRWLSRSKKHWKG